LSLNEALSVKKRYERYFLKQQNVCGVGVGWKLTGGRFTDNLSVVIMVTRKLPVHALSSDDLVLKEAEGIKTDVLETGIITAPPPRLTTVGVDFRRRSRQRPASGGCSISHWQVSAGTLGCLVKRGELYYILSNNHVLANENAARIGDSILQPGKYDGGTASDQIATLSDFVHISFNYGTNKVDAALAFPGYPYSHLVSQNILDLGVPTGFASAKLGDEVIKSGRTTGITRDYILITDATIRVHYSEGKTAVFENQLITRKMSEGGDSGSVVLTDDGTRRVCGLLFAGSDIITVINRIEDVTGALNITL
jgi:hypothetical protein